jgi:hypothetical protein
MTGMTHQATASYSFFSVRAGAGNRTQRCASDRRHLNRTRRSMLHHHNGTELNKKKLIREALTDIACANN